MFLHPQIFRYCPNYTSMEILYIQLSDDLNFRKLTHCAHMIISNVLRDHVSCRRNTGPLTVRSLWRRTRWSGGVRWRSSRWRDSRIKWRRERKKSCPNNCRTYKPGNRLEYEYRVRSTPQANCSECVTLYSPGACVYTSEWSGTRGSRSSWSGLWLYFQTVRASEHLTASSGLSLESQCLLCCRVPGLRDRSGDANHQTLRDADGQPAGPPAAVIPPDGADEVQPEPPGGAQTAAQLLQTGAWLVTRTQTQSDRRRSADVILLLRQMMDQELSERQTQLDQLKEKNQQLEMMLHMHLGRSRDQVSLFLSSSSQSFLLKPIHKAAETLKREWGGGVYGWRQHAY